MLSQTFWIVSLQRFIKMKDLTTIRVTVFHGESNEMSTWSEKLLVKAQIYGFKVDLLGNMVDT
jgi:hypothetical protein